MYFKRKSKIKYFDCDVNDKLKISSAIRLLQQTSSEQLEELGFSVQKLYRENMVFLLSKTNVKIHRMPNSSEIVNIGTAPIKTKGPRFYREFTIETPLGEHLVDALTIWILVDPPSRKILRPKDFPYELPFVESITNGAISDIAMPKLMGTESRQTKNIEIAYSYLDINNHVNNSYYADFVCDMLPYDALVQSGVDTMALSYGNEAKFGETIELDSYEVARREFYFSGTHSSKDCFEALVRLKE